jgi:heat shock protein HslJ
MKNFFTQKLSPIVVAAVAVTAGVIRVFGEHASVSAAAPADLPGGLTSPEQWVLCNPPRGVCFDRMGASIGLTEAFLGQEAAAHLTDVLREISDHSSSSIFAPANGVECGVKTGPCCVNGVDHAELTDILYGPSPLRAENGVPPTLLRSEWKWQVTRFNDDTTSEPSEPGNYTLRLEPDGTLHARADCNRAGGQYRVTATEIHIEINHSTRAACPQDSLEMVFLRDLSRATHYVIKAGRLYVDLEMHTGTMELVP